jgi:TPR repeat protein
MAHIQTIVTKQICGKLLTGPALIALVFSLSHLTESHCMDNDIPPSGGPTTGAASFALTVQQQAELMSKAEAGDAEAAFRLSGYYGFMRQDYEQEQRWLTVAARSGHATAQYNLASDLSRGGKDLVQAARWATEALKSGHQSAARLLVAIEAAQSAALAPEEQAALAAKAGSGNADAAFRLSRFYNFVLNDRAQTRRWRKLAAEGGNASAQYDHAVALYSDGEQLAEAARWAAEARKNGDADAGRLLQEIEALQSASLAPEEEAALMVKAEAGDAEAAFRLSKYHHFVHKDGRVRGRRWLVRAAEGGQATAQYDLALVLQLDGGSLAQAERWAAQARGNGDADAQRLLQRIEALHSAARRQPGN